MWEDHWVRMRASGSPGTHLGGILEASGKDLGAIWEGFGRLLGGIWQAFGRHLEDLGGPGDLGGIWEPTAFIYLCFISKSGASDHFA